MRVISPMKALLTEPEVRSTTSLPQKLMHWPVTLSQFPPPGHVHARREEQVCSLNRIDRIMTLLLDNVVPGDIPIASPSNKEPGPGNTVRQSKRQRRATERADHDAPTPCDKRKKR